MALLRYLVMGLSYLGLGLGFLPGLRMNRTTIAVAGAALLLNLVSNVPAVVLLYHLIPRPTEQTWLLLAAASTLAGNLTLLGSVANLIVAEAVAHQGYQLTFWEHFRFGLPLTAVTLVLAYCWIGL